MSQPTADQLAQFAGALLEVPEHRREAAARALCGDNLALLSLLLEAVQPSSQNALADRVAELFRAKPFDPPSNPTPSEAVHGATIGGYRLLECLGEGGFGVVYAAEQVEPIRRRVALKIIKAGMDSRAVVARFEAERQALAMMDHPNIAKVLGAGATKEGRPYFVMELVRGVPITMYCEENRLSPRERISLMIPVCHAIQHAHQKGIIHRDIKPTNVLVTIVDGKPVPQVIDFGIAKAISGPETLTDKTIYTQFRQFIGTPAYMSPEQLLMSGVDVDTRSDVYSLGVLMYQLLCGSLPYDTESLLKHGVERMQQAVREQEPPKPSTRIMTMDAGKRTTLAAARRLQPDKLTGALRGEVDWMVMKAVEKDRARRYQSAIDLADDLTRYLQGEAVKASPPSRLYQARKLFRRHRVPLLLAAGAFAGVLALLASVWWGLQASRAQEARARAALTEAEHEAAARREAERLARRRAAVANLSLAIELLTGDRGDDAHELLASIPIELRGWEWKHASTIAAGAGSAAGTIGERTLQDLRAATAALKSRGQKQQAPFPAGVLGPAPGELVSAALGRGHVELHRSTHGFWGPVNTQNADSARGVQISPDGGNIALSFERSIQILPAPPLSGLFPKVFRRQTLLGAPAQIRFFGWDANSDFLYAQLADGSHWRWPLDDSAGEIFLPAQYSFIFQAEQSARGDRYFLGFWGMVRALEARTFMPVWTTACTRFYVERLLTLSGDRLLAISNAAHPDLVVIDSASGQLLQVWSDEPVPDLPITPAKALIHQAVVSAAVGRSPAGEQVLLALNDGSMVAIDTRSWSLRPLDLPKPAAPRHILTISAAPDGAFAFSQTLNTDGAPTHDLVILSSDLAVLSSTSFSQPITSICWTTNPASLLTGDSTGTARLIDRASGRARWTSPTPSPSPIRSIAWLTDATLPDEARVVALHPDGRVVWLDPADGEPLLTRRFAVSATQLLASPDGSALFVSPVVRLETSYDPALSSARVVAQRTDTWMNLAPTAESREEAARSMSWNSDEQRDLVIRCVRALSDDLPMRNSDALTTLTRRPAAAIEAEVLPITRMLVRKRPHSASLLHTHAWALTQAGRDDEAIAALDQCLTLTHAGPEAEPPDSLALRARLIYRKGLKEEARRLLALAEAGSKHDPEDALLAAMVSQAREELLRP